MLNVASVRSFGGLTSQIPTHRLNVFFSGSGRRCRSGRRGVCRRRRGGGRRRVGVGGRSRTAASPSPSFFFKLTVLSGVSIHVSSIIDALLDKLGDARDVGVGHCDDTAKPKEANEVCTKTPLSMKDEVNDAVVGEDDAEDNANNGANAPPDDDATQALLIGVLANSVLKGIAIGLILKLFAMFLPPPEDAGN